MQPSTHHHRWCYLCLSLGGGLAVAIALLLALNPPRLALAAPHASPLNGVQAIISVDTTNDEYDLTPNATCSLREAIQAANTNAPFGGCPGGSGADVINVMTGTYVLTRTGSDDTNINGDLDIITDTQGLTINGVASDTTIIDANGIDRVLHALSGTLTLTNLTVCNGAVPSGVDGGGVYVVAGGANVSAVTFYSNTAGNSGGGAFFLDTASVTSTSFSRNLANGSGAGSGGGGAYFNNSANVTGTIFVSNTVRGLASGGGSAFNSTANVSGTTYSDNLSSGFGG